MTTKEGERSGYTSPDMPPTPATSQQLKRSASQETLATEISDVSSSPSLAYPNAPLNTPATPSIAGDEDDDLMIRTAADIASVANRLQSSTPPTSPTAGDEEHGADPFHEGRAHLRTHVREDSDLSRQLFKSPERKVAAKKQKLPRHEDRDRANSNAPPTLLRHVNTAINLSTSLSTDTLKAHGSFEDATPGHGGDDPDHADVDLHQDKTFEYNTWGPVAEEDTERALKRMAMLARDEHQKDPSRSVEEYYSERLARLIEEAEVEFDAMYLR